MAIAEAYGPQVEGETGLKRLCRLQQSWYRVERLGDPAYGPHRPGGRLVGSALLEGEKTHQNFLSSAAREYAAEKLEEKRAVNPDLTIERFRLFNNMLSSQPMCFNLFSDVRAGILRGDLMATAVVRAMFLEAPIAAVEKIEVEHLPQPRAEYIRDKTAFDASVLFNDAAGSAGIVTIETKYTDSLGKTAASEVDYQLGCLEAWGMCTADGLRYFRENQLSQIARNLLLTIAFQRRHALSFAINCVVGLGDDRSVRKAVEGLRDHLRPSFRESIRAVSLEDVVARGRAVATGDVASALGMFWERYLDLDRARELIA